MEEKIYKLQKLICYCFCIVASVGTLAILILIIWLIVSGS